MSASVVLRCEQDWTPGDPCRVATPVGVVDDLAAARAVAARLFGWDTDEAGRDRCPACRRRAEVAPRPAPWVCCSGGPVPAGVEVHTVAEWDALAAGRGRGPSLLRRVGEALAGVLVCPGCLLPRVLPGHRLRGCS